MTRLGFFVHFQELIKKNLDGATICHKAQKVSKSFNHLVWNSFCSILSQLRTDWVNEFTAVFWWWWLISSQMTFRWLDSQIHLYDSTGPNTPGFKIFILLNHLQHFLFSISPRWDFYMFGNFVKWYQQNRFQCFQRQFWCFEIRFSN